MMTAEVFTNQEVAEASLPEIPTLTYEALAPTYSRTLIVEWIFYWLIAGTITVGFNIFSGNDIGHKLITYVLAPYLVVLLSVFVWAPIVSRSRGFAIREKDLHYKSGVIWQKTVSLPFNRIQHVEIESRPLDRFYKLATLKFFTAGGGSADLSIPGLEFDRASRLRAFVLEKAGAARPSNDDVSND